MLQNIFFLLSKGCYCLLKILQRFNFCTIFNIPAENIYVINLCYKHLTFFTDSNLSWLIVSSVLSNKIYDIILATLYHDYYSFLKTKHIGVERLNSAYHIEAFIAIYFF